MIALINYFMLVLIIRLFRTHPTKCCDWPFEHILSIIILGNFKFHRGL